MKTLVIAAGLLLMANADAKVVKPESGSLVISKVFYAASKGAESGNYAYGQYIELYNNSADDIDITGVYVGLIESEAAANAYTVEAIAADADLKSKIGSKMVLKQLFQIPDDKTYTLESGKSIVICNSAIDHTALAKTGHNLSNADFEVKTTNNKYQHNDAVPAMKMVYSFNTATDFMNLAYSGPAGVVLLKNNDKAIDLENKIFARGKEKGNQYILANPYYCIDVVDILANTKNGIDQSTKRINDTYDAGFTSTAATGTYNGETVYRKTSFITADGRTVLYDTNNSSVDFQASGTIQPRTFDTEMAGLTEATIVIPESGYQVFRPEKSFFGPKNLYFVYLTGNKKNANVTFNNIPGDSSLVDKGNYIAVGKPGTYTVTLSDAQPTQKVPSNLLTWSEEDTKELTGNQATRSIYKWHNEAGKVGFQRVPATADGKYNVATFSGEDRLYLTLTADMVNAFYAANNAASAETFDFIIWQGATPEQAAAEVKTVTVQPATDGAVYDLQGRRVIKPKKGIYVKDRKKVILK